MLIFPAIDLIDGQAVRLVRGDYSQKTVFNSDPEAVAYSFIEAGASHLHLVDLEGAKNGSSSQLPIIKKLLQIKGLKAEIGGGIRSMQTVEGYLEAGAERVILSTAAVTDPEFLQDCIRRWGDRIAVGVDIKDGAVAIRGWTELSQYSCEQFFEKMQNAGVATIICTDVSKDGLLQGTNLELYRSLSEKFSVNITASGGISSIEDIRRLKEMKLYGAILGKALYTGDLDLRQAVRIAEVEA